MGKDSEDRTKLKELFKEYDPTYKYVNFIEHDPKAEAVLRKTDYLDEIIHKRKTSE